VPDYRSATLIGLAELASRVPMGRDLIKGESAVGLLASGAGSRHVLGC
jgi:hypothetical protein